MFLAASHKGVETLPCEACNQRVVSVGRFATSHMEKFQICRGLLNTIA